MDRDPIRRIALLYAKGERLVPVPLRIDEPGNPPYATVVGRTGESIVQAAVHSRWSEAVLRKLGPSRFAAHACLIEAAAEPPSLGGYGVILDVSRPERGPRLLFRASSYRREDVVSLSEAIRRVRQRADGLGLVLPQPGRWGTALEAYLAETRLQREYDAQPRAKAA